MIHHHHIVYKTIQYQQCCRMCLPLEKLNGKQEVFGICTKVAHYSTEAYLLSPFPLCLYYCLEMLVFHCCTVFCKWNMSLCSSLLFSRWDLWAQSWTQQWQERQEERSCEEGDCQHDSRQGCEVGLRRWTAWYKRVQSISEFSLGAGTRLPIPDLTLAAALA